MVIRCDLVVFDFLSDLYWPSVSAAKRGEALAERKRREAVEIETRDGCKQLHDEVLLPLKESDGRSSEFEAKENGDADVEALEGFPITMAGSILKARHGTRRATLIPKRKPPARKKKEIEKGKTVSACKRLWAQLIVQFSGRFSAVFAADRSRYCT